MKGEITDSVPRFNCHSFASEFAKDSNYKPFVPELEQIDTYYQQNAWYLWIESGCVGENMNLYFASKIRNYLESVQYTKAPKPCSE